MLVLSRKQDEKIIIGDSITLMVVAIQGDKVRLGIEAPVSRCRMKPRNAATTRLWLPSRSAWRMLEAKSGLLVRFSVWETR